MKYKVSVIIISYNHEKYIEKAIKSVLSQKSNFKIEILLGDDCSTDGTREVIEQYKDKIRIYYRDKNIGSCANYYDLCMKAQGEYISLLEGDDYWIGENRLQILSEFLDRNKEYSAVGHMREMRDMDGKLLGYYPNNDISIEKDITKNGVLYGDQKFAISGLMYRNFHMFSNDKYKQLLLAEKNQSDIALAQIILEKGKVYNLKECLGCYVVRRKPTENNFCSIYSEEERLKIGYRVDEKTALFFGNKEMFDYKEAISGCAFLLHKIREGKICEVYKLMKVMGWKRVRNMIRFMPFKILKKLGIMAYDAKPYLRKQDK